MHSNGVPVEMIRQFLGHADIKTTWGYIYNNQNKEKHHKSFKIHLVK
ncbi:protein of unknown function [Petrocella atlantisensis]|uniref:Tyr recombinase domain-containing protein n=1 Tax=Petrocella atlantisensis TaxID=2173034 RepID=A0A3P7PYL6_9FIRM|nr:protein of unknown function [Petrocella atlantisensis]